MNLKMKTHLVYFPCKLFVSVAASIWPSLQQDYMFGGFSFLAPTGAQEIQMSICLFVRPSGQKEM